MSWQGEFAKLTKKSHTDQAIWWLNGFWGDGAADYAETIWEYANIFIELQTGQKVLYGSKKFTLEEKCDLDELQAHKFLEKLGETLTVKELRAKLKKLDIDSNNRLALSEYLLSKYNQTPQALVDSPQGGVPPEIMAEAQAKVDAASESLNTATESADAAKAALDESRRAGAEAAKCLAASEKAAQEAKDALEKSNLAAAEAAETLKQSNLKAAEAKKALEDQEVALADAEALRAEVQCGAEALEAEEKAYNDKIIKLENKLNDKNLSTVKRGSFVQRLAMLKAEDPLPLSKAKITQNAVLKKQKKLTKKIQKLTDAARLVQEQADEAAAASAKAKQEADEAAAASAKAKEEADEATKVSEEAEQKANSAVDAAQEAFVNAKAALTELKNDDSAPFGRIWWMSRIMQEKEKYMPRRKKKKK